MPTASRLLVYKLKNYYRPQVENRWQVILIEKDEEDFTLFTGKTVEECWDYVRWVNNTANMIGVY